MFLIGQFEKKICGFEFAQEIVEFFESSEVLSEPACECLKTVAVKRSAHVVFCNHVVLPLLKGLLQARCALKAEISAIIQRTPSIRKHPFIE